MVPCSERGEDVLDVDDRHCSRDGADVPDRALRHADGALDGAFLRSGRETGLVALHQHGPAQEREAEGLGRRPLGRDGLAVGGREAAEVGAAAVVAGSQSAAAAAAAQPSTIGQRSATTHQAYSRPSDPASDVRHDLIGPSFLSSRGVTADGYLKGGAWTRSRGLCPPTYCPGRAPRCRRPPTRLRVAEDLRCPPVLRQLSGSRSDSARVMQLRRRRLQHCGDRQIGGDQDVRTYEQT